MTEVPGTEATAAEPVGSGAVAGPDAAPTAGVARASDPGNGAPTAPPRASRLSPWVRTLLEWVVVLVVALLVAVFVRTYVVQTYFIPSISMEPTLQVGDHILVLKAAYRFTSPAIGDVIVFKAPPAEHSACDDPQVQDLVKRIIATPGDTIASRGQQIILNGHVLKQPWQHTSPIGQQITPQKLPAGQYFVMGDNRSQSCDSRIWGTVPRGDIIGKAIFIFWPPSRIGTI